MINGAIEENLMAWLASAPSLAALLQAFQVFLDFFLMTFQLSVQGFRRGDLEVIPEGVLEGLWINEDVTMEEDVSWEGSTDRSAEMAASERVHRAKTY